MKNFTKMFLAACLSAGFVFSVNAQSVGINADGSVPNPSAGLDVNFTNKGFLPPRLTTVQIEAIVNPADGLQVYNTTVGKLYVFVAEAAMWKEISYGTSTISPPFVCGTSLFSDPRDSKTYNSVQIGTQCWMKENIAWLPSVVGPATGSTSISYYYVYGYDGIDVPTAKATSNFQTYGVLYNWPASLSACPSGWHLPTDDEWCSLATYLDATVNCSATGLTGTDAGGKMKETDFTHWTTPNTGATNTSGFTALPGGYKGANSFTDLGSFGTWWSSSQESSDNSWFRYLIYNSSSISRISSYKAGGFSVRCLKDN